MCLISPLTSDIRLACHLALADISQDMQFLYLQILLGHLSCQVGYLS